MRIRREKEIENEIQSVGREIMTVWNMDWLVDNLLQIIKMVTVKASTSPSSMWEFFNYSQWCSLKSKNRTLAQEFIVEVIKLT